jgi:prevent-host-death family protein
MSPLRVSEDLVSIATFKANASQMVRQLRRRKRPFVITLNGRAAAVVLSPKDFDRIVGEGRFADAVREGLEDSEAGRVIPDDKLDLDGSSARR